MKTILRATLCAILITLLSSCQSDLRRSAQGYLDAVANYDFERAIPYASERTRQETLPFFVEVASMTDTNYIRSNTPAKIKIRHIKNTSDTTAVVYYHKSTPIKQINDSLQMVRHDDQWYAEVLIAVPPQMRQLMDAAKTAKSQQQKQQSDPE